MQQIADPNLKLCSRKPLKSLPLPLPLFYLLTYMEEEVFVLGIVANGLLIAWPNLNKWCLVKTIGLLRYVSFSFIHGPMSM